MNGMYIDNTINISQLGNLKTIACKKLIIDDYKPGKWYANEFEFTNYSIYYEKYFIHTLSDMELYELKSEEEKITAITSECSLLANSTPYKIPYLNNIIQYIDNFNSSSVVNAQTKILITSFPDLCSLESVNVEVLEIRNYSTTNRTLQHTATDYVDDNNRISGYLRDNVNIKLLHLNYPTLTFCKYLTSNLEKFYITGTKQDLFKLTSGESCQHKVVIDPNGLYNYDVHDCRYVKTTNPASLSRFGDSTDIMNVEFGFFPNSSTQFRSNLEGNTFDTSGYLAIVSYHDPKFSTEPSYFTDITANYLILLDATAEAVASVCNSVSSSVAKNVTHYVFGGPGLSNDTFDFRGRGTTGSKSSTGSNQSYVKFVCINSALNLTSLIDVGNWGTFEHDGTSNLKAICLNPELTSTISRYAFNKTTYTNIYFQQLDITSTSMTFCKENLIKHFRNVECANKVFNSTSTNNIKYCYFISFN